MSGFMSPNEARVKENLNPVEGGDMIMLPLNMRPADQPLDEDDDPLYAPPTACLSRKAPASAA
jgi:hypothetical protein